MSAYLKGEEARSVTAEHIDAVLQRSASFKDAIESIKSTDIGEYLWEQQVSEIGGIDELLWNYLRFCIERIEKFRLPKDLAILIETYNEKFDILNLKIALRNIVSDDSAKMAQIGKLYKDNVLDELMKAENIQDISNILSKSPLVEYTYLLNNIKEIDHRSIIEGENGLDNLYNFFLLKKMSLMDEGDLLVKAFGIILDIENLKLVFRSNLTESASPFFGSFWSGGHMLQEQAINEFLSLKPTDIMSRLEHTEYYLMAEDIVKAYEKERIISVVDRTADKHKIRLLKELLSPRTLSPCNLFWYFFVKELEIKNVRLILKTLADGLPPAVIREYAVAL